MEATSPRWQAITDSEFPWEREALAFVRERLPDHDPYRAWANFEFIADDGSINEVDLLVLTTKGFYLVEIKSRPGTVEGDQGTWTWRHDGRLQTVDNPLLLANRKAKKLISLLRRHPALRKKAASPFLEAHVFLLHEDADCRLTADLRDRVHRRDAGTGRDERPGIVAALTRHSAGTPPRSRPDRPMAKAVSRAMQEAGIRRSQRSKHVGYAPQRGQAVSSRAGNTGSSSAAGRPAPQRAGFHRTGRTQPSPGAPLRAHATTRARDAAPKESADPEPTKRRSRSSRNGTTGTTKTSISARKHPRRAKHADPKFSGR